MKVTIRVLLKTKLLILLSCGLAQTGFAAKKIIDTRHMMVISNKDKEAINKIVDQVITEHHVRVTRDGTHFLYYPEGSNSSSLSSTTPSTPGSPNHPAIDSPLIPSETSSVSDDTAVNSHSSPDDAHSITSQRVIQQDSNGQIFVVRPSSPHEPPPLVPIGQQVYRRKYSKKVKEDIHHAVMEEILDEVARLECQKWTDCGNGKPCVDYIHLEDVHEGLAKDNTSHRTVRVDPKSKKFMISEDYGEKYEIPTKEKGFFVSNITCVDEDDLKIHDRDSKKMIDEFNIVGEVVRHGTGTSKNACSSVFNPGVFGGVSRHIDDSDMVQLGIAVTKEMLALTPSVGPAVIGAVAAGPLGAVGGAALTTGLKNTALSNYQTEMGKEVQKKLSKLSPSFENDHQRALSQYSDTLKKYWESYEKDRPRIYIKNRAALETTFNEVLKLLEELNKSMPDKDKEDKMTIVRERMKGIKMVLNLPHKTEDMRDEEVAEKIKEFKKVYHMHNETLMDMDSMLDNVKRISHLEPHEAVGVHPLYYVNGKSGSGKTLLVDKYLDAMGLPHKRFQTTGKSVEQIKDEMDNFLIESDKDNPVIVINAPPGLLKRTVDSNWTTGNQTLADMFDEMLGGPNPELESKIATAQLNATKSGKVQLSMHGTSESKVYHDLKRVTFIVVGEPSKLDDHLKHKFKRVDVLTPEVKDEYAEMAKKMWDNHSSKVTRHIDLDKLPPKAKAIYDEIIEFAHNKQGTVPNSVLEQVVLSFRNALEAEMKDKHVKEGDPNFNMAFDIKRHFRKLGVDDEEVSPESIK